MTKFYDSLPLLFRIVVQLLFGSLFSGIYRILRYLENRNIVTLGVGVVAICTGIGNLVFWLADLFTLAMHGRFVYFVD